MVLAGDSAGGGLCVATMLTLKHGGDAELPRCAVLLSPWLDLSCCAPDGSFNYVTQAAAKMCRNFLLFDGTGQPDLHEACRADPGQWCRKCQCHLLSNGQSVTELLSTSPLLQRLSHAKTLPDGSPLPFRKLTRAQTARAAAADAEMVYNPLVSPVFASIEDLRGLPPVLVQVASRAADATGPAHAA